MQLKYFPNAKINIGLYVVEKRTDGYHNLETVFYPLPVCDELTIEEDPSISGPYTLTVEGMQVTISAEDNHIIRAFRLLEKDFQLGKTAIRLKKNIPFGAGLGGGSSDAAFMLIALNELYRLNLSDSQLEEYAVQIGADCPFFIRNKPVLATGIGNIFSPLSLSLKGYQFMLVKPDIHVSTAVAYAGIKPQLPAYPLSESILLPVENWKEQISNDFEKSVFIEHPVIGSIKDKLYAAGAVYASMSGSGSSVVALFAEGQTLPQAPESTIVFTGIF